LIASVCRVPIARSGHQRNDSFCFGGFRLERGRVASDVRQPCFNFYRAADAPTPALAGKDFVCQGILGEYSEQRSGFAQKHDGLAFARPPIVTVRLEELVAVKPRGYLAAPLAERLR
jgi:hypothetical protein